MYEHFISERGELLEYKIGQKVRGKITGIQPYGVFVELDENTQGLIHISELKHAYVKDISEIVDVGEELTVQIMDIDEYSKQFSLSIRSLTKTNHHPFSNRRRNPRYGKKTGLGFKSIDESMPGWVDEALNDIRKSL